MQFVLLIYQGTTPLPNTDAWSALPKEEQRAMDADYAGAQRHARPECGPAPRACRQRPRRCGSKTVELSRATGRLGALAARSRLCRLRSR